MSEKMDDLIGQTIKHYKILELIGRGIATKVYTATDEANTRTVAFKLLIHHDASLEIFETNMEVIRQLEHPHILPVYDYGNWNGMPYVVMAHSDAGSLAEMIQDDTATVQEKVKVLQQVCDALDYAHKKQIIHRDVKPSNILIDDTGNAYLADFGIPKYTQSHEITSMGSNIGTAAYLPPEQAMGDKVDERSDIFSLGITLFEVFAGHHPFSEEHNQIRLMMKMMNEPIPPLQNDKLDADTLNKLNTLIQKAAAKQPADRYASIAEFAKELDGLLAS